MCNILPSLKEMPKIPSELIEPYLKQWLMVQLEYLAYGCYRKKDIDPTGIKHFRTSLEAVMSFNSHFGGLHSTIATSNIYGETLWGKSDEQLIKIADDLFGNPIER